MLNPDSNNVTCNPILSKSWLDRIGKEFNEPYMIELKKFLTKEIKEGKKIAPKPKDIFAALNRTSFERVKVVIIGQDPYFSEGQANGLSFSVANGIKIPTSLNNIFKELHSDLAIEPTKNGCLNNWADQGVLMLNSVLTVEIGLKESHAKKGWERFTDAIVNAINLEKSGVVFILWGKYARSKAESVDKSKHFIIESAHPSGLSAHRGFFGSNPFSKTNSFLTEQGLQPIDWKLD